MRLIRELRPPANARSARPDRYVYLRRRGDTVVCSATPGALGPIKSRRRAQLAARALQGVEWDSPRTRSRSCRRSCDGSRASSVSRMPHACATGSKRSSRSRPRSPASSGSASSRCAWSCGGDDGRRRGFFVAKGQVVCVRPFNGAQGVEWQAGLAAVARAEPSLAPESTDELLAIAGVPAAAAAGARGGVSYTPRNG